MILWQLFLSFAQIGLFSVGGGYAAMPLIQQQTVLQHAWLTLQEFADLVTIAEMTPGPIAINAATFVGQRMAGLPGACAATLGCIFPSLIIVSILAKVYLKYRSASGMQTLLSSIRPVVVALIATAGLSLLKSALFPGGVIAWKDISIPSVFLVTVAFLTLRIKKCSPIWVMALCGVIGLVLHLCGIPV